MLVKAIAGRFTLLFCAITQTFSLKQAVIKLVVPLVFIGSANIVIFLSLKINTSHVEKQLS